MRSWGSRGCAVSLLEGTNLEGIGREGRKLLLPEDVPAVDRAMVSPNLMVDRTQLGIIEKRDIFMSGILLLFRQFSY